MLIRKMLRDIRNRAGQFIAIFLMSLLAMLVYSGLSSVWYGVGQYLTWYNDEFSLCDFWVYTDEVTDEELNQIEDISTVEKTERRLRLDAKVNEGEATVYLHVLESNTLNKPYIVSGNQIDLSKDNCVWLDINYANANSLSVGDQFKCEVNSIEISKVIEGLVYSPEYVYYQDNEMLFPDYSKLGFAYISQTDFPFQEYLLDITDTPIDSEIPLSETFTPTRNGQSTTFSYFNELILKTAAVTSTSALEEELTDIFGHEVDLLINREEMKGPSSLSDRLDAIKNISGVFPVAFILVALLIIASTMSRLVAEERMQIGTLKAIGFSKKRIMFHYMSYSIFVVAAGSLIGMFLGRYTIARLLIANLSSLFSLPSWTEEIAIVFWIIPLLTVGISALVSYLTIKKTLSEASAQLLRPKESSHFRKMPSFEFLSQASFITQWNFRDLLRNIPRSMMVVVGVACSTALLLAAFTIFNTFSRIEQWMFYDVQKYQTEVYLKDTADSLALDELKNSLEGKFMAVSSIEIKTEDKGDHGILRVVEDTSYYSLTNTKLKELELNDGEIAMSEQLARRLNIGIGDSFEWRGHNNNKWEKGVVDLLFYSAISSEVMMTESTYVALDDGYRPTMILSSKNYDGAEQEVVSASYSHQEVVDAWSEQALGIIMRIIGIFLVCAILMSIVVLYNLALMSYVEKERELATLKVLGFGSFTLRKLLLWQNLWLSMLGIVIGLAMGQWLSELVCKKLESYIDVTPYFSLEIVFLTCFVALAVSVFTNLWFSKRVNSLDLVASLKSVD